MKIFKSSLILILICTLISCSSKKEKLGEEIFKLETSDSSSTPKGMNNLAEKYFEYFKSFTKDSISEIYLYKAFMFKYLTSNWNDALQYSDEYKKNYGNTENLYNIYLKKADIYNVAFKNIDSSSHYYLLCDGKIQFSSQEYRNAAITIEKWVQTSTLKDSLILANALFTCAKNYQLCTDYEKSVKVYEEIAMKNPYFNKSPQALSTAAFICWNDLKQIKKAKIYYELLVKNFPENDLAKEAMVILNENLLEMTDTELAEYLIKKEKTGK